MRINLKSTSTFVVVNPTIRMWSFINSNTIKEQNAFSREEVSDAVVVEIFNITGWWELEVLY